MKVALFGGSFNPPHIGHTIACCYLLDVYGFDKVWIIPCYEHPFDKNLIGFEERYEMCLLAFKLFKGRVVTTTIEYDRKCKSYTIDTVLDLKKRYSHIDFSLIIGEDIVPELGQWKDIDKLRKIIDFIILPRNQKGEISDIVIPPISSSDIREQINAGKSIEKMVSYHVTNYISKNQLYRNI